MHLDFWNNPLVVSALRVQYRRGGLFSITVVYLLVLGALGAGLEYYSRDLGPQWPRFYYLGMVAAQFAISGLIALNATNQSMRTEVVKQTFDFQRITALSPAEILLGKLLGEPAVAYLLAIATIPLAVWCWLMGAGGVTFDVVVLTYINLGTFTVLCGALGLIHRLEPPVGKQAGTGAGAGLGVMALILLGAVNALASAGPGGRFATGWPAPAVGLLTPIPFLVGLGRDQDAWRFGLSVFGREIPYLLVAPVAELLVAYLCFHAMKRRLVNPANPPFSKPLAYGTLAAVDYLLAAMLFSAAVAAPSGPFRFPGTGFGPRAAAFCVSHLLLALWLVTGVTPWRETLLSWVWRFRGRRPRLLDWWLGDRSENGLVLLTFALIGLAVYGLLVVLPDGVANGWGDVRDDLPIVILAPALTTVLLLSLGTTYQWMVFIAGRYGKTAFMLFLLLADLVPHILGSYYEVPLVLALSPSAHAARWFGPALGDPLSPLPLLAVYGALLLWTWIGLRRRLDRLEQAVDRKLKEMGVVATG
jgi:hypothetical protein